ncbi:MAG: OmpA family protein [Betaproteobacteria bacterium]|nr:OmpA family protein [Betaproteobacteria bacterium]
MSEEKPAATVSDDKVIYFPLRVAIVDDAGKQKLRQHAQYLKQNPKSFVMLLGYIDDEGSRSYNLAITEQRILAVRKLLRTYGAPMKQIRRKSEKTQSKCASADCRQKMRKVELIFSP